MNDADIVKTRTLISPAARYHDLVYILSQDIKLKMDDVSHSSVISIDQGEWANAVDVKWDSNAICVAQIPEEKLVFVGEKGQVCTYVGGRSTNEQISPEPLLIRRANTINGYVYACGMGREVYKRIAEDQWVELSAQAPKPAERVGFEAIDGYSEVEIYTVGWNGEIWYFDGSSWINNTGLTNLILTSICCAGDEKVYITGQQGLLIKGRRESWEIIKFDDNFTSDFWDVHWFNGRLYLATMTGLYFLEDNILNEVIFDDVINTTFYNLSSADGVMWSIGSSNVLSFDGETWKRYA